MEERTRATNTRQPQKRADCLRSYLEPSQSVRAWEPCADGQLCVCSESCTDGQTIASRERAKSLLGMATLPPLTLEVFVCLSTRNFETASLIVRGEFYEENN